MLDILVYASFKNATTTLGELGLVPTITAWSILKVSPYTKTEIVSAQNATEIGRGLYYYVITGANLETYEYPAVALTNGTPADVIDAEVHMLKWDGAEAYSTQLGYLTENVATEAKQDIIDTTVDSILVDTGTTLPATLTDMSGATFSTTTDSLEAIRDRGDVAWITSVLDEEDIWTYSNRTLTQTQEEILAILSGSDISVLRGDTWTIPITGLGSLVGRTKLYFTVRKIRSLEDDESEVQIEETAKLIYIHGEAIGDATPIVLTDGTLTVTDEIDGDISVVVKGIATTGSEENQYYYDVQVLDSAGNPETLRLGFFSVSQDVTRATT